MGGRVNLKRTEAIAPVRIVSLNGGVCTCNQTYLWGWERVELVGGSVVSRYTSAFPMDLDCGLLALFLLLD